MKRMHVGKSILAVVMAAAVAITGLPTGNLTANAAGVSDAAYEDVRSDTKQMGAEEEALAAQGETDAELPGMVEVNHTTVTEAFDWGPAITKVVLDIGRTMDGKTELDKDLFEVYVERKDPATGKIIQVFDYTTWKPVDSKGNREVKEVYVSDASGNKAQSGNYVTVEMTVDPTNTLGSPFNYDMEKGVNTYVTSAYTVTQKKVVSASDGTAVAVKSPAAKFQENKTLICDDFDLEGTFNYKDPEFGDISLCYASYAPKKDNGKNPLIIWLHGAGEGGKDPSISLIGNKVVNLATEEIQQIFGGAYILAPQSDTMWMNDGTGEYTATGTSKYTAALMELIKEYVNSNSDIDTDRIYIGGCSNGGYMTMNIITAYPNYFAAAYPICEAYKDEWLTDKKLSNIEDLPIWFTHSRNDGTVMICKGKRNETTWQMEFEKDADGNFILNGDYSPKAYERLVAAGNKNVHITLYDDVHDLTGNYFTQDNKPYQYDGHWSWIYTLNNDCKETIDGKEVTIMEWLAKQKKGPGKVTHTTVTEGFDWGPAITKVVLNVGKTLDRKAVLTNDTFDVYVERRDPVTGEILKVFDFTTWQQVDSKGNREIKEIYVSDASGNKAESGDYITIEMKVDPTNTLGSPFNYDMEKNVNTYITSAYTITQKKVVTASDGTAVTANSPAAKFEKNNTLICDDFDLTGTFDYKDPEFGDISLCYASYAPKEDDGKNPLIIWLHGQGEGGKDPSISLIGNKVVNLATEEIQQIFGGAYILAPQSDTMWMNDGSGNYTTTGKSKYTAALMELIRTYVRDNKDIDTNRIYIGGCSNGGYMTMNMITEYPDYFTAAYPVCEAYKNEWLTDEQVNAIKDLPIWFTHSKNDGTVMISKGKRNETTWQMEFEKDADGNFILNGDYSPKAHERLVAAGNKDAHITLYEDVHDLTGNYFTADNKPYQYDGHWSWIYTLNNDCKETINGKEVTIMEWLASKVRTPKAVDKTALNEAISKAEKLKEADYTEETWKDLQSALASAKKIAEAEDAMQSEVTKSADALTEAMDNLKTKAKDTAEKNVAADKEALKKPELSTGDTLTLPTVGENGSVITWTSDNDAVKINGGTASITKGDTELTVKLTATITYGEGEDKVEETVTFEIKVPAKGTAPVTVNKAELNSLIQRVQGTAKGNYTDDSWNAFQSALTNARKVNDDQAATQAVVDSAKAALETAVKGLTVKTDISKAAKVTVSPTSNTYTGKKIQPKVVVKAGNVTLKSGTDYTVAYKNNVKVGKASVVITGTGKYMGTVTKTFNIVPKATSIKGKVTAKSKGFIVKWAKGAKSSVTGYEVQYSTDKKFKKKVTKTKTIKKLSTTKLTVKKLKAKKKYYVRVRTYKKVKNAKYVSKWSKTKTVKTK